ncbi:hypothetical protein [Stenotrophomonas koreensis]|uniref:hypothetical protein n=1 Tax=Stenotrophomonas koreensis TaxID=266128 RepID=UPI0009F9EBAB|nr:hypothetical protein [Stenotrophomonas koreensis]
MHELTLGATNQQRHWRTRTAAAACLAFSATAIGACSMTQSASKMPMASASISTPADLSNARIFDCAEAAVSDLSQTSSSWPKITLRDESKGVLESGDYPADDKTGFRMRLERINAGTGIRVHLKGAGAYYVDLGVQKAIDDLTRKVDECIKAD